MKKILITGSNSFVGTSFEDSLKKFGEQYLVKTISLRKDDWRNYDFSQFDSVFHVAGIAHADTGAVSEEQQKLYYDVNCNLAVETANKAKKAGVKQFIYMSSIIVYGNSTSMLQDNAITETTEPSPANFYGDSKLKAENLLRQLENDSFKIAIIRPPMIYGKGCKGNYPKLARLAAFAPIFPNVKNQRSMLYVGNLCEFIRLLIENNEHGIFFPQNSEYVNTSELVKTVARFHGKDVYLTKMFNPIIRALIGTNNKVGQLCAKCFGNMVYDKNLSNYKENYNIYDFEASIKETEC